jgi:hypothetical protein
MTKKSKTRKARGRRLKRVIRPIPREELKTAMKKDFEQHMIDSYTPDRGYPFPVDNVEALISKYWPNNEKAEL